MGKAETVTAQVEATVPTEMKRKKKKGRPSLSDLNKRDNKTSISTPPRRSTRRNPNSPPPDFIDDDDERKEKKVKLVVRLPQHFQQNSSSANSLSDSDADDNETSVKRQKIDAVDLRSDDAVADQGEKLLKAMDTSNGSPLVSGPTTPLPDKKLLVFILDRLQKKDTYGVFSEPVDPDELPDYHEIIEHPMDFGTLRKKLDEGLYSNLEELEADVFLICSNAMQYNAPDTVYFRQARSIQDLAKRDFDNLRHEGEDGELQPKVVRRGRPPSKNIKKSEESSPPPSKNLKNSVESSPIDCIGPELSSGATLASAEEKVNGSNSYNLRKGPMLYKFRSVDTSSTFRSRNGETHSEWSIDWNNEFPASILRADMKYGKKHFSVDENRRDTYELLHPSASCGEASLLWNADGDLKRLMAVGIHFEQHAYARSLARFAANLGPVVWKVATKKLETVLPAGVKFGPGWVGEGGGSTQPSTFPSQNKSSDSLAADHHSGRAVTPSLPGPSSAVMCRPTGEIVEAAKTLNSQNELAQGSGGFSCANPASTSQAQQKHFLNPRNGFNGMLGYGLSTQMEVTRLSLPKGQPGLQEASRPGQVLGTIPGRDTSSHRSPSDHVSSLENSLRETWTTLHSGNLAPGKNLDFRTEQNVRLSGDSRPASVSSGQYRQSLPIPPDLNVKVQTSGSPSSSIQVGSPQQPDLVLQL
ncbi:PREDICTED: uncharacterized protein LOC109234525 [Nicotiana attenuata]|uniref:Transcription factor gte11 n=1 Tax=Nicotiana attenuata TaxID=49451 RepID=A0A1J6IE66_NICAT|nr:PREDICTED: uncharacterized protein LOC109234525 [Nicotiana attenuata]OIS97242.1 transcription factor gte11 [Nicotiana attenuata]